jgi:type I protein arginine methyltransferase
MLGFDLSVMAENTFDEAIVDVVGPETMLSAPYTIKVGSTFWFKIHTTDHFELKDLVLSDITTRQLDFTSSFILTSTAVRRSKINAFVLYFDTFFTLSGHPISPSTKVKVVREGEPVLAETWPVGGKPPNQRRRSSGVDKEAVTSFSTGPESIPTHWKQTLFLLREPILVVDGRTSSYARTGSS